VLGVCLSLFGASVIAQTPYRTSAPSPYGASEPPKTEKVPQPKPKVDPPSIEKLPPPKPEPETPSDPPVVIEEAVAAPVWTLDMWKKVPHVQPAARSGWPILPPSGPGYYSLRDRIEGKLLDKPPKYPYGSISLFADSFFNVDFRFLEDPENQQTDFFDPWKRWLLTDNLMFSTGGEFRYRYMGEANSRLTGRNNDYHLFRARTYGDLWFRSKARLYVEFISATQAGNELPSLAVDRNNADLLNLFVDWKLFQEGGVPAYLRVGRQELLLGSQRLVSPIEWANTRRSFEGFRWFWHSPEWNVDVFAGRPVIVSPNKFDDRDINQTFSAFWLTKKLRPGTLRDFYVLYWSNARPVLGLNGQRGGQEVTTFGTRWTGDIDGQWLYDFEGMYKTGNRAFQLISAGAFVTGVGYRAKQHEWNPSFWAYNEWASGTPDPAASTRYGTFNQLFAFGHYYMGYIDYVGRQNINDFSLQVSANPAKWITSLVQYHHFTLVEARDALYNLGGGISRRDLAGASGVFVGQEMDTMVNFHLSSHQDLLLGYSVFFPGDFIRNTGPGNIGHFFYSQYSVKW
jgi:hypothetical protein